MQQIDRGIYFENSYPGVTVGAILLPMGTVMVDAPLRAEDARTWRPAARCALVMGPEDKGLDADQLAHCDRAVAIPMASGMDSLNVAAAGAILMFRMIEGR